MKGYFEEYWMPVIEMTSQDKSIEILAHFSGHRDTPVTSRYPISDRTPGENKTLFKTRDDLRNAQKWWKIFQVFLGF